MSKFEGLTGLQVFETVQEAIFALLDSGHLHHNALNVGVVEGALASLLERKSITLEQAEDAQKAYAEVLKEMRGETDEE